MLLIIVKSHMCLYDNFLFVMFLLLVLVSLFRLLRKLICLLVLCSGVTYTLFSYLPFSFGGY